MIGTYASAALICAASMLVGRAHPRPRRARDLVLAGAGGRPRRRAHRDRLPRAGAGARDDGDDRADAAAGRRGGGRRCSAATRAQAALCAQGCRSRSCVALVLSIPFAVSGRWGMLGVGFNNDLGLHLAWAEWLRSGFGPAPEAGYPLGPHGLAVGDRGGARDRPRPGLHRRDLRDRRPHRADGPGGACASLGPVRRAIGATLVAIPYLAASYFAQAAFKETAEALFVLAFAICLLRPRPAAGRNVPAGRWERASGGRSRLVPLALAGGIFFSYSFAGLAWPVAIVVLWGLTVPAVRRALAPRRAAALPAAPGDRR